MPKALNLEGKQFGRWTVIEKAGHSRHKKVLWRCRCSCGNERFVGTGELMSGGTKSCGCLKNELVRARMTTHGKINTRLYSIWGGMKSRCHNKNGPGYYDYGGRGITVCKEWENFDQFYEWAMKNGYRDDLTIDRIDVNGNYEPDNCRWITNAEQQRNKRDNHYITYNGETNVLRDWSKILGINESTLSHRINSYGWSVERAFTTPVRKHTKKNCLDTKPEIC